MADKRTEHVLLECFLVLCFVLINITSCHNVFVVADLDKKISGAFFKNENVGQNIGLAPPPRENADSLV